MPHKDSSQRVFEHHERRKAAGENSRTFYVREEHMQILRRFQIENGYSSQHSALQAMMERFRGHTNAAKNGHSVPRTTTNPTKDGT